MNKQWKYTTCTTRQNINHVQVWAKLNRLNTWNESAHEKKQCTDIYPSIADNNLMFAMKMKQINRRRRKNVYRSRSNAHQYAMQLKKSCQFSHWPLKTIWVRTYKHTNTHPDTHRESINWKFHILFSSFSFKNKNEDASALLSHSHARKYSHTFLFFSASVNLHGLEEKMHSFSFGSFIFFGLNELMN